MSLLKIWTCIPIFPSSCIFFSFYYVVQVLWLLSDFRHLDKIVGWGPSTDSINLTWQFRVCILYLYFFLYYIVFKLLYIFWYVFFYLYNFDIFVYPFYVHIIFCIISYFNYFFHIIFVLCLVLLDLLTPSSHFFVIYSYFIFLLIIELLSIQLSGKK